MDEVRKEEAGGGGVGGEGAGGGVQSGTECVESHVAHQEKKKEARKMTWERRVEEQMEKAQCGSVGGRGVGGWGGSESKHDKTK